MRNLVEPLVEARPLHTARRDGRLSRSMPSGAAIRPEYVIPLEPSAQDVDLPRLSRTSRASGPTERKLHAIGVGSRL